MSSQLNTQIQPDSGQQKISGISVPLQSLSNAESVFDATTPIVMLNLLRFHTTAIYPTDPEQAPKTPSISGREAYMTRYVPAFQAVASKISPGSASIAPIFIGAPAHSLVTKDSVAVDLHTDSDIHKVNYDEDADDARWDMVALVSYPNLAAFRALITNPEYLETAQQHRMASLKDWRLIVTRALEM